MVHASLGDFSDLTILLEDGLLFEVDFHFKESWILLLVWEGELEKDVWATAIVFIQRVLFMSQSMVSSVLIELNLGGSEMHLRDSHRSKITPSKR